MTEQGVVVGCDKNFATIRVDKKDECSKCGLCVFGKNVNYVDLNAKNDLGAVVGDKVIFEKKEGGRLLASIMVFLIPLLLIIGSTLVGILVIKSEIWSLFLSLISILLWYTVLAFIEKKIKKGSTFCAEIISIEKD